MPKAPGPSPRSALPRRDPTAAPTLGESAKVAVWGLAFWSAAQFAVVVFARNATAAVAVQAALAEWGAGRMTIAWSDPLAPVPTWQQIAGRAGRGAALGGGAACVLVAVALATHAAQVAERSLAPGLLAIGLIVSLLAAARDELLLRGVVLRTTRGLLPWWASLLACGASAAAARYGLEGALGMGVVVEALRGLALGALWLGDRGAWMAVGANAAWTWTLGSVVGGGLLDVRFTGGAGQPGDASPVALGVATVAAIAAAVWGARRQAGPATDVASGPPAH
jgi:hypothetical protein